MRFVILLLLSLSVAFADYAEYMENPERPLVVAHRGSCGELPEHSAAAYTAAFYDGADFDEPDLQVTKDGVLFIMHNPCMKETTNIESIPQFANRKTSFKFSTNETSIECHDDYLVNDFTWDELISAGLKLRNRYSTRNTYFNDMFPPQRLDDAIELLISLNKKAPRAGRKFKTGLYIETKYVAFYQSRGVDIAKLLYETLAKYNIETIEKATKTLPIIIESFEQHTLLYFKNMTDLPRIQLMFYGGGYDLDWVKAYSDGVGPKYQFLFSYKNETLNYDQPSLFIQECHDRGLKVHPWILQDDFLIVAKNSIDEANIWYIKGVDGYFTEFPQTTLQTLEYYTKSPEKRLNFEAKAN